MYNMGNIIQLMDGLYEYEAPSIPRDEKDIWFYDKPKKDQFWVTPKIPDVRKMSEKERIETIDKWRDWWLNGIYIFLNGEPVYLTGLHFEHLVLNTYNSQKLMYFDDERYIFYFIEKTENTPECEGRVWVKPRRAKMTTIMCSLAQRKLISDFSNYITIQSDTLDKAQKSYMNPIIDSYVRRPIWSREDFYAPNGKKPRKSLELRSNLVTTEVEDELMGGSINIFPALAKATDGLEAVECIQDEFSKVTESSPYETYEVNRKVIQNFRKQGKIDSLSSTGDSKEALRATIDWHTLISKSNPLQKDKFGKTQSGSWKYFINAIHSQYVPKEFTDIYGRVDKERAEEWVQNEIDKYPEGTKERIFAMYKLPLKEEHALLSQTTESYFNRVKITVRLQELDGLPENEKPYIRGRLDENLNGRVSFEPDPTGLWLWAVQPYFSIEKNIDTRNRFRVIEGVFFPPVNPEGVISYDPINYPKKQTSSSNISRAAITIHKAYDYFNSGIFDEKIAIYVGRPDDPHEVNREAMKAARFTGFPVEHERSVSHVYEDFEKNNMLPFLLQEEDGLYGISASNQTRKKDGLALLQARYSNPKSPEDKDHILCHPFPDSLRDLYHFDFNDTQKFDLAMTELYLELALKKVPRTNVTDDSINDFNKVMQEINPKRR